MLRPWNLRLPILRLIFVITVAQTAVASDLSRCTQALLQLNNRVSPGFSLNPKRNNEVGLQVVDPRKPGWRPLESIGKLFERPLGFVQFTKLYRRIAKDTRDVSEMTKVIDALKIRVTYDESKLSLIPKEGPLVLIANHPLFGIDGAALVTLLERVRPDVKIVLTSGFGNMPEAQRQGIFITPAFDGEGVRERAMALRQAVRWVQDGHALVIFPAGALSKIVKPGLSVPLDTPWKRGISLILRESEATVLPVFVHGSGSKQYLSWSAIHKELGGLLAVHEIMGLEGKEMPLTIGDPIPYSELKHLEEKELIDSLRQRTYQLGGIDESRF